MVTVAIIGKGFVGNYLKCNLDLPYDCYDTSNICNIQNKHYDLIYCAGLYSHKDYINKNGDNDLINIFNLQENLISCNIKRFILISTIEIYDKSFQLQNENNHYISKESYGKNRYYMEEWVISNYTNYNIIRLPNVFGLGLKQNIIYDILNNNCLENINLNCFYQWYYIDNLIYDIDWILKKNIKIINLFSEPIETKILIIKCFPRYIIPLLQYNNDRIEYNYTSQYFNNQYRMDKKSIFKDLIDYIKLFDLLEKNNCDKFVVSNLTWNTKNDIACFACLKTFNIKYLELAISKYIDLDKLSKILIQQLYHKIKNYGMNVWSLSSLFYAVNLNIFIDRNNFTNHFKKMIDYGIIMNAKILVYGSPKSRFLPQGMNKHTANFIFQDVFKYLCSYIILQNSDLIISLQPCGQIYGCNYINTIDEAINMVNQVNNKHFKLNLDTGSTISNREIISKNDFHQYIAHTQLSLPNLRQLTSIDRYDDIIYKSFQYPGKITLKMNQCNNFQDNLIRFISLSQSSYSVSY